MLRYMLLDIMSSLRPGWCSFLQQAQQLQPYLADKSLHI